MEMAPVYIQYVNCQFRPVTLKKIMARTTIFGVNMD